MCERGLRPRCGSSAGRSDDPRQAEGGARPHGVEPSDVDVAGRAAHALQRAESGLFARRWGPRDAAGHPGEEGGGALRRWQWARTAARDVREGQRGPQSASLRRPQVRLLRCGRAVALGSHERKLDTAAVPIPTADALGPDRTQGACLRPGHPEEARARAVTPKSGRERREAEDRGRGRSVHPRCPRLRACPVA